MPATILVLDGKRIYRDLYRCFLEAHGMIAVTAADATEALGRMRETPVDLIMMDLDLAGMSGLEFIGRVRRNPATNQIPAIILTDVCDKGTVIRAAGMGVRDYVLKNNFSAERLLERMRQLLKPATAAAVVPEISAPAPAVVHETPAEVKVRADIAPPKKKQSPVRPSVIVKKGAMKAAAVELPPPIDAWPRLLTREKTLERLDAVAGGKTIAGVVAQVVSVASSPNADLSDVVRVIQSDPVLASRVLMMANSAASGSRSRVSSIDDAARAIGVRGIQNMAISIGIFGTFPPNEQDGFNTMRCWQHSFAVGELMGMIVRQRNPEQESLSHLVGLCHDLGEILLRQHFMAEHEAILAYAMEHGIPFPQVEAAALGIRHPELISRLLSKMGLPPNVVDAIREFYERQGRAQAAGMSTGAQLLGLANLVAHGMQLAASTQEMVRPISRTEWRILSPEKPPPVFDPRIKRDEILTTTNVLARLPAREEHRLLAPLIERGNCRIAYVRPEIFIELDPLAYALELLCDVTIMPALPLAEELKAFDGVVLAAVRSGVLPVVPETLGRLAAAAGRPELPMLAVVSQGGPNSEAGTDNWVQFMPAVRLLDLELWLKGVQTQRDEAASESMAA